MLEITITRPELYDDKNCTFIEPCSTTISLEHSLISISKWESKWNKPFLATKDKTEEEIIDYVRCMTTTQKVNPDMYNYITNKQYEEIGVYVNADMTATKLPPSSKKNREIVTSELIYYWMVTLNIPFECQKWHLNRLLTLINVCNIKNSPPKKMSRQEIAQRNTELNAQRRKALGIQG